jgi:predicted 3-demethylubiquinone-9 3-methyltransferase (glyoxalase superfamily)
MFVTDDDGSNAMPRITPNLWFDTQGLEAAEYYTSIFPNSKVTDITYYGEGGPQRAGDVLTVNFELDGQQYTAINGGPQFTFDEAISLLIECADQAEIDYYWEQLSNGGEEGPCGWLKDKYGLSWQIVPDVLLELTRSSDREVAARVTQAMYGMRKLDVAGLRAAATAG